MKSRTILSALAITSVLSLAAQAEVVSINESYVKEKANGGYESKVKTEKQTLSGTTKTYEKKVDVNVKSDGNINKVSEVKSITDPKGILNQQSSDSRSRYIEKPNGGYEQVTTSKYTDNNGADVTLITTTIVDVEKNGNVKTTAKTEKTIDPKGLLNKTSSTSEVKILNGKVVESKSESK